jgi:hypothetical protein
MEKGGGKGKRRRREIRTKTQRAEEVVASVVAGG